MSWRGAMFGGLIAGAIGLSLAGAVRGAELRDRSVLAGVQGLEKPVSFSEIKIPLGELVQKVAADTGVKLTAAPEVADEPVAVVVHDLPARELLQQVAELLDYGWGRRSGVEVLRRSGVQGGPSPEPERLNTSTPQRLIPTYAIWQDLAARNRETAAREAALADVERRLDEQVRQFAALAALPPEQIQALAEQYRRWQEQFFQLPPAQRVVVQEKEGRQMERAALAARLRTPINRTLALLIGRLSPEQWAILRQGQPLRFSTDPQTGELRLPDEMVRDFRSARPSMDDTWRYGDTEFAAKEREKQRNMEAEWAAATGYRISLRLNGSHFERDGGLSLGAYAMPLEPKAGPPSAYSQAGGTSLSLGAYAGDDSSGARDDSPERAAALAKDPLLGAVKRFKRQPKLHPDPDAPPNRSWTSLQELLPDVARSCGLNIIADSYGDDRSGFPVPAEEPTPVYLLLDRITRFRYRWERSGSMIRNRYRAWFFARPKEVPRRIVRHWNALLAGGTDPPLEEYAATAAMLSDERLELFPRMLHVRGGDTLFVHEIFPARHALRLYASLSLQQQQALWQGQPYPFGAMTPAQRELFVAPWREGQQEQRDRDDPSPVPAALMPATPLPPLGPDSHFGLTATHQILTLEKRGDVTHFNWQDVPAPGAALAPSAGAPRPSHPPGTRAPGLPSRRALTRVTFQFDYSPELQPGEQVTVAPTTGPPTAGPAAN